jgi:hypothetical protein
MKTELKAVEDKHTEIVAAYERTIASLERHIAELEEIVKLTKLIEKSPEFATAAAKAGVTLEVYLLDVMERVKNPDIPVLPMPKAIYDRIARIADMRGMTLTRFMHSEDMRTRVETAIDNLVY